MEITKESAKLQLIGKELALHMLKILNNQYNRLEDESKKEKIQTELIPIYENLYIQFNEEIKKEDAVITEEEIKKIAKPIYKIIKENNLSEDNLLKEAIKRNELHGNSGAEIVKKMMVNQIKAIESKVESLVKDGTVLLKKELEYEEALKEEISAEEEDRLNIDLDTIKTGLDLITDRMAEMKTAKRKIENDLQKRWKYEIFGTLTKEELLKE
ncbi:MAG: hypothetical protein B6I28_06200 [Fusobacteriia bacterium 4572_132]|nr:MAG: hypothetical protein B6I28_06200 [Fusobacteriia bacterium 4572_132]